MEDKRAAHEVYIEEEGFTAYFDDNTHILHIIYRGVMSPAVSARFYQWLGTAMREHTAKVMSARGSIYDFRDVTEFANSTITSTQRQSQQMNQQADLQNHPVALIARDPMQASLLSVTMKISPQQERKRIVRSEAEALAFIDAFHREQRMQEQ